MMPEMHHQLRELTNTLSQAQQAVERELEHLAAAPAWDMERLAHLGRSVGEFSYAADSLLLMMLERKPGGALVRVVEGLVDYFRTKSELIAALLQAGGGSG